MKRSHFSPIPSLRELKSLTSFINKDTEASERKAAPSRRAGRSASWMSRMSTGLLVAFPNPQSHQVLRGAVTPGVVRQSFKAIKGQVEVDGSPRRLER